MTTATTSTPTNAVAHLRFVRMGPRKLRRVANAIRGKSVREALALLKFADAAFWTQVPLGLAVILFAAIELFEGEHLREPAGAAGVRRRGHDLAAGRQQGAIGGIRVSVVRRDVPKPGTQIERYVYEPFDPATGIDHKYMFASDPDKVAKRCRGAT